MQEIFNGEIDNKIIECPLMTAEQLNSAFPLRLPGWGLKKNLRPIWSVLFEKRRGCLLYDWSQRVWQELRLLQFGRDVGKKDKVEIYEKHRK